MMWDELLIKAGFVDGTVPESPSESLHEYSFVRNPATDEVLLCGWVEQTGKYLYTFLHLPPDVMADVVKAEWPDEITEFETALKADNNHLAKWIDQIIFESDYQAQTEWLDEDNIKKILLDYCKEK